MSFINEFWDDYKIIDAGNGEKLERWKDMVLRRPDPQCLWLKDDNIKLWNKADAIYHRSNKGGGNWEYKKDLPDQWTISYKDLSFKVSPTGFKHTGLFPEQAANWDWFSSLIKNEEREIHVLNLFAYTGAATLFASYSGAKEVVHVDAAKGMVNWAKENMALNKMEDRTIRFIVDDVNKFVQREKRRNHIYQGIIMDPPSYGRGPNGEMWKLEEQLPVLINNCLEILDDDPLFFLVNTYSDSFTPVSLYNLLNTTVGKKYPQLNIDCDSLCLKIERDNLLLPCGISGRVSR